MDKDNNENASLEIPTTGTVIHQEFNFHGNVQNINPAAATVNNTYNYYSGAFGDAERKGTTPSRADELFDKEQVRNEIIEYAYRLHDKYKFQWQPHVRQVWSDIVQLPAVAAEIYCHGRQRGTHFHRNLVGNIINHLNRKKLFEGDYNMTEYARLLRANDKDGQSVRNALGDYPPAEIIEAIDRLLDKKKYF